MQNRNYMKNCLKYFRCSKGYHLTQEQLASSMNVSRATISAVEKGCVPSAELMLKLANFFKVDPREIFFEQDVQHVKQKIETEESAV
jgi:DNA-binding XRE family transcriptional regulator